MDPIPDVEPVTVRLRRADEVDAEPAARLLIASRRAAIPAIPPPVHPDEEAVEWFCGVVMDTMDVWLAETTDSGSPELAAVMVLSPGWVEHLYVRPGSTGRGVGTVLLDHAKATAVGSLDLWTFQSNVDAQRFYERHGFVQIDRTDGGNEEGAPDVRYRWRRARR